MKKTLLVFLLSSFCMLLTRGQQLHTATFSVAIDGAGRITVLENQGHNYAPGIAPGFLLQLKDAGRLIAPVTARVTKNNILLTYPGGKTATIHYENRNTYIRLTLAAITPGIEAIQWGPINTTIDDTIGGAVGVVRSAFFAIGIQALNKKTSGGVLANDEGAVFSNGTTATVNATGSSLQAFAINRSIPRSITVWDRWPNVPLGPLPDGQLEGSAIALFGCKPADVLPTIRTITVQEHLPYAKWDDQWIKTSPAPGRPYMITTFDENNIDTFLDLAKRMGMAGVYHEDPFDTWGHFQLKRSLFPHDRAGFRHCVTKAHAMGLRLGFHVLSNFITTNDSFVTPRPDPRLATAGNDTLETSVSANATTITIRHPGYFLLQSDLNAIRIGDELIRFTAITNAAPYTLTGCTRGAFGTTAATHTAGDLVYRLIDHPYMVLFPDWQLQKTIAANIARFINETGADQMDFDGHEGTYATGMGDLSFNTFAEDVFNQADHPVVFGSSRANHYFWHFDDYLNWGEPWYGGFRESQSDQRIANQHFYEANYLPNMLGWFLITAQTTPDDIGWMLARAAGYHAGYALVVRKEALANPHLNEIVRRIRLWTNAIDSNRFSASQREWLRDPSNEAELSDDHGHDSLERLRKFTFVYEAPLLQPGQPTAMTYDFQTARQSSPTNLVITAEGLTGTIDHPLIELDHAFHMVIPVTLSAGESVVINSRGEATIDDRKGRFSRAIALPTRLPEMAAGTHTLLFDATMDAHASVKARLALSIPGAREALGAMTAPTQASILPERLRCEYLKDPQGIDEACPRLGWTLAAADARATGQQQTAYRILVSSSPALLAQDKGDCWDSHWISSDNMQQIEYHGLALKSDRSYYWKVRVRDEAGNESAWSAPAYWSTGLFTPMEWTAHWIGTSEVYDPSKADCNLSDPWFRKSFTLPRRPERAVLFVASVGYHELYVNGEKIGYGVLAPKITDYSHRARYIAYDIAGHLHSGSNVIALWLGAGWSIYSSFATGDKPRMPLVIAQADISIGDSSLRIRTDETWKTHPSPNRLLGSWSFGHMGGELWDDRKVIPHWSDSQCIDTGWTAATVYHPKLTLSAQMVEQNHIFHEIRPVAIESRADGSYRIDMGVNFAGWTRIRVHGEPGKRIDFEFSERPEDDMTFDIHSAFIPGASGAGAFQNRFNYSSGRWITIRGLSQKPTPDDIRGWVVRTAYDSATSFECSDSLQNWIYDRCRWNYENLSLGGYLVDCPQRERLGYGGDANATCETGLMNYHTSAMYTQWMEDWRDVQGTRQMDPLNYGGRADDGILPHTAPTYQGGGGPSWGGITVVLPWYIYLHEGDTRILEKNFPLIERWLAFLDSRCKDNLLVRFGGTWDFLGDWLWPHAGAEGMNNDKPQNSCYNNCYRVYDLRIAAKIARVIGRTREAEQWERQAAAAAAAINATWYHPGDHSYADSSMGNLAIALLAEVPAPDQRAAVMDRLGKEILVVRKGHIHVGITGGAFLFRLLRLEGRDDLLYSMTAQTDYPGWGYMKANGATSLWEAWEKDLPGHSLLHSSFLYPAAWDVQGLGGIHPDPQSPGYRHFIVRVPHLSENQLQWAKTSFESPAGLIKTAWERHDGKLQLSVTVPPNTHATVYFPGPDGAPAPHEVAAGSYEFSTQQHSSTAAARSEPSTDAPAPSRAPHIVNIVNFIRLLEPRDPKITEDVLYQTVVSQIRLMKENHLGGTFLLQYDALMNPRYQQLLKSLPDSNFEIGAWWEITQPHVERAGLHWRGRYPWDSDANVDFSTGYSTSEREKLVDVYMEDFKKIYGHYPASVGSWFIDSYTLDYMYRKYGIVATCNCKDQIGTDGYTLWGGYWNQGYYPSLKNAYMPAQTVAGQLPVPVFRMLGSDPIRQYESGLGSNGQGVITLEPVYPHAGGDSAWVHWYFDQFVHGACMTYAYVQAGQENSFTWPAMQKGLDIQFPLIARLRDSGLVKVETLAQAGRWFKTNFKLTPPTSVTAVKDLDHSDKKAIWFDSRFFRLSIAWEAGKLRIRDLHLFDENISDNIKKDSATGSYALLTLPFVDGFVWSDKTHLAGIRLKSLVNGTPIELEGGDPVVTDSIPGKLHIVWPLSAGNAKFVVDLDERHIKMHMEGQAPAEWWLELTTAPKTVLPFTGINPRTVQARFHGTTYSVHAAHGLFEQPAKGPVLKITPEAQSIVLDL